MATKLYSVFKPHHQYFMKNCINTVSSFTKMNSVMCSTIEQKDHFPKSPTKSRIFEKCQNFSEEKKSKNHLSSFPMIPLCNIFLVSGSKIYVYVVLFILAVKSQNQISLFSKLLQHMHSCLILPVFSLSLAFAPLRFSRAFLLSRKLYFILWHVSSLQNQYVSFQLAMVVFVILSQSFFLFLSIFDSR